MGMLATAVRNIVGGRPPASMGAGWGAGGGLASAPTNYAGYARAMSTNEIVYACVNQLARSASEPHIIGRRMRRERVQIRAQVQAWNALGVVNRAGSRRIDTLLVQNKYVEEVPAHPLVTLLNQPNPMTSRGQFWATIVMHRKLAGNAYALKARNTLLGNVQELWPLRPDRVRVVTDAKGHVIAYEYRVGNTAHEIPAEDVIHFKELSPLDDYYGMPPLMPAMGRVQVDAAMRQFLAQFFHNGGTGAGSILTVKQRMEPAAKEEIRDRFKRVLAGGGFHEMLILDQAEASYEQLGLDRGIRDALPKELDAVNEARIAMVFGIPGSILGLLIGYESSSYANKRQDWQVLWDVTMTPLLSDLDDQLNLSLVPEFAGIDEVMFDLSDIRALQEDEDALQERARKNVDAGLWSWEEGRIATGVDPNVTTGRFFVRGGTQVFQSPDLEAPEPEPAPVRTVTVEPPDPEQDTANAVRAAVLALAPGRRGRPPLLLDTGARALWEQGEALRAKHPGMTWAQVAGRVGVDVRTFHNYRSTFGS